MLLKSEYEQFAKEMQAMQERPDNFEPVDFNEEDFYTDEYKNFLKKRFIDNIYILR